MIIVVFVEVVTVALLGGIAVLMFRGGRPVLGGFAAFFAILIILQALVTYFLLGDDPFGTTATPTPQATPGP